MAVTPETGAGPANPMNGAGLMSEDEAVSRIADMLNADPPAEEPEEEKETPPQEAVEEEAQEAVEEAEEPEAEETETDETEPEAEPEELPDTLQTLAEALEMEPGDLASHLKVPIKVKGFSQEVTLAEAIQGYQREQDYSLRINEVADERKQLAEQKAAYEQQQQQALQEVYQLGEALRQRVDGITDDLLMKVFQEQGQEAYMALDMQKKRDQALLAQVQQQGQQMVQQQQSKLQEHRREQQAKLVELIPEFRDPEKGRQVQSDMTSYLETQGFTGDEVAAYFNGPFDARYVAVLRDAARYRDLMAKSKKVGKKVLRQSKPKKSGNAEDHKPPSKLTALRQNVRKVKHDSRQKQEDAAVGLISQMIRGE